MGKPKGGKREGAGRKSKAQKLVDAKFVADWLTLDFQEIKWKELVNSQDQNVSLKALMYLTDRIYGKAAQPLSNPDGSALGLTLVHAVPRPERE